MTTAEMEALARKVIAEMVAEGEAGRLDAKAFEVLKRGLAERRRILPVPKGSPGARIRS